MRPACSQDANSLQLWEILQSTSPERGIGSLNCPSKTPYYSMRRAVRPDNSAELCEEFVAEAFPWTFCEPKPVVTLVRSTLLTRTSVGQNLPAKTESADGAPSRRHYADAQYFREAG